MSTIELTADQKRLLRNLQASMRRRITRRESVRAYVCVSGPFQGEDVYLTQPETAWLAVGDWRGRYRADTQGRRIYGHNVTPIYWEATL